jgi:hypothetical protein
MFEAELATVRHYIEDCYAFDPSFSASLGKHGGQLARVALTFHCLTTPNPDEPIPTSTMRQAIMFMRTARRHWYIFANSILTTSPVLSLARALARSLAAETTAIATGSMPTVARAWMSHHCKEFRKADDRTRREAVQTLEDVDWIECDANPRHAGGWPTRWKTNPLIWQLYGEHGEKWRQRREAVRAAILGDDSD